jgi:uncharacterized protein YndB with AHSA1/START domain
MMDKNRPLIIEQLLKAPASHVWDAITSKEQMKKWYCDLASFETEVGFEFQFEEGPDDRLYLHKCRITEVIPLQKLSYTWRYEGYPGVSTVLFLLEPQGTSTLLRLIHEDLRTFPGDNPDFAEENFRAGWTHIIQTALREFFEGSDR